MTRLLMSDFLHGRSLKSYYGVVNRRLKVTGITYHICYRYNRYVIPVTALYVIISYVLAADVGTSTSNAGIWILLNYYGGYLKKT